jgi:hypothetical protein
MKSKAEIKTRKMGSSGNPFFDVVYRNFISYLEARKVMIQAKLRPSILQNKVLEMSRLIRRHLKQRSIASFVLAALPYTLYLLILRFYTPLRKFTHLDLASPPSFTVLPNIEEHLFLCQPHKFLSKLANPVFDVLAAIPYLMHFPLPFMFGIYLALHPMKRGALLPYMWCAGWVNFLAVLIQFVFPTASPWFVDSAIFDEHGHIIYEYPNEAGFKRLDGILGYAIFHSIYSQSPLKFGSFPSLHVAWPMIVFLNHPWLGRKFAGVHVVWITLAAIYSTHHYLMDCLCGILMCIVVKACVIKVWSPFPELEETSSRPSSNRGSGSSNESRTGCVIVL